MAKQITTAESIRKRERPRKRLRHEAEEFLNRMEIKQAGTVGNWRLSFWKPRSSKDSSAWEGGGEEEEEEEEEEEKNKKKKTAHSNIFQ